MKQLFFLLAMVIGIQILPAHPPWGIVVDRDLNIYFPDIVRDGGSIWKLDNKGNVHQLLKSIHAHNVNLDSEGNIVTAHGEDQHILIRINQNGAIDTLLVEKNYRSFFGGNCAWSPSGEVIFGTRENKKLKARDLAGNTHNISDYEFSWNQTIYVDDVGTVYAPDIGVDNGIIVRIDVQGNSEVIAKDMISKLDRPKDKHNDVLLGITKGSDGHIYVAETAGKQILRILDDGSKETFYRSENGWYPCGIDFFSGDAYILESIHTSNGLAGPRIVKIDESGNKTILFNFKKDQQRNKLPIIPPPQSGINWTPFILLFLVVDALIIYLIVRARRSPAY
jgi:DNA-binding beta-propeller fold protein YncE